MNYSNEIYIWIHNFIFVIGILLIPIGLGFMLFPVKISKLSTKLNQWVSTDKFFYKINTPIYKERFFYRHHRIFGILVLLISLVCLYMLTFSTGIENITESIINISESEFEKWLFVILYYIFIVAIVLALIFGLVMFIRPSVLKSFEAWSNHWVDADASLKVLDKEKDILNKFLPSNPRIFGFFVMLGAIYIIYSTYPLQT